MNTETNLQKSSIAEIWKPIKGYESKYEISSTGRVKSLGRHEKMHHGGIRCRKGRILNGVLNRGYKRYCLFSEGKREYVFAHRLVAQSFIPNPENKVQVNHLNGVPLDNRVKNLAWCTPLENTRHAHITGLCEGKGENQLCSVLTEKEVVQIREEFKNNILNQRELAEKYNVSRRNVNYIINRKWWKHI